jgi:hypothetical protein
MILQIITYVCFIGIGITLGLMWAQHDYDKWRTTDE